MSVFNAGVQTLIALVRSTALLLLMPPVQRLIRKLRCPRRFWVAPRGQGFWQNEVTFNWKNLGERLADWEEKQYLQHYRISKRTLWFLVERYGVLLKKEETCLRRPVPYQKRIAILLHWLAHGLTFAQVAALYGIAKSTAVAIVHEGVSIPYQCLMAETILFPTGAELVQVVCDFESLCGLPRCAVALDGTFMKIQKLTEFGDAHYCYKHFTAIIVLGCVDGRGIFTYVNAGRPGSVGSSYTYRYSLLWQKISNKEWLDGASETVRGHAVKRYLVVDSALPLSSRPMKCYGGSHLPPLEEKF